jgi:formamidopyrimidine-DNA glycosylase
MPELPEVETARRIIERTVVGAILTSVTVRLPKMLRYSTFHDPSILEGRRLLSVRRRAKVLMLDFSEELSVLIHLKLSGQVSAHRGDHRDTAGHPVPDPAGPYPHRATHVSLDFDNGYTVHLSDLRQFGWIRIMAADEVDPFIAGLKLGPEANGEEGITPEQLAERLARRTIPIKLALLNQSVVAGIGNIYVDEALHRVKVHPTLPSNQFPRERMPELVEAIRWAIDTGTEQGGARIIHNKAYPIDGFPEVHARKGEPCPVCGDTIQKMRVGSRGTYFCPTCQATDYVSQRVEP